jgi:hypothetical protein
MKGFLWIKRTFLLTLMLTFISQPTQIASQAEQEAVNRSLVNAVTSGRVSLWASERRDPLPPQKNQSTNIDISTLSSPANQVHPAIDLDENGNAYAVWMDGRNGNWDIYFAYRPVNGTWGFNTKVNDDTGTASQKYPAVAVDASGNAYAVWRDERNGNGNDDIYFAVRPSGGTWGRNIRIADSGGISNIYPPAIAVDETGNAYILWTRNRGGVHEIFFVYRSANGSWEAKAKLSDESSEGWCPDIAVDLYGNAYAIWTQWKYDNDKHDTYFSYRPAGGAWGSSIRVNDDDTVANQWWPSIAVDNNGNAYATWMDHRSDPFCDPWEEICNWDVYYAYSMPGWDWQTNSKVNDDSSTAEQWVPDIQVGTNSNLYAVWSDYRNDASCNPEVDVCNVDIYSSFYPANGDWTSNVRVNDDSDLATQYSPKIAVDDNNNVYSLWSDNRNTDWDIYFAVLSSNGAWGTNTTIVDSTLDVRYVDQVYVQEEMECISGNYYWNYCGPSSLAMLLYYEGRETRDVLYDKSATEELVCEIKNNCRDATIPAKIVDTLQTDHQLEAFMDFTPTFAEIRESIDNNHPVLLSLRDPSHILIIMGYQDNGSIVVNDPYGSYLWWKYPYPNRRNLPYSDQGPKLGGKSVIYQYEDDLDIFYAIFLKGAISPSFPQTISVDDSGGSLLAEGIKITFPPLMGFSIADQIDATTMVTYTDLQGTDYEVSSFAGVVSTFEVTGTSSNGTPLPEYRSPFTLTIDADSDIVENWHLTGGFSVASSSIESHLAQFALVGLDRLNETWTEIESYYLKDHEKLVATSDKFTEYALVVLEQYRCFLPIVLR